MADSWRSKAVFGTRTLTILTITSDQQADQNLPEQLITPAAIRTRSYLLALRQRVWDVMDSGGFAHDISALALPEFRHWVGYDLRHGFNAQRAWRELEPEWMGRMSAHPSTLLSEPSASLH